jgi:metal-responsive CopG/Arc/MetJ family transcriptional regulator
MEDEPEIPDYGRTGSDTCTVVASRLPEDLVSDIDDLVDDGKFDSRSEAVRELVEERLRSS